MQTIKFTPIPKVKFSLELINILADWDNNLLAVDELNSRLLRVIVKNAQALKQ